MLVPDDQHLESDRRAWPRFRATRPCKIHDPRSGKYMTGTTCNLSSGGVMVEIDRPLEIGPGETLHIAIAQTRRQPLIRTLEMIPLRTVRALRTPDGQTVLAGVFENGQETQAAPLRRAA